MEQEALKNKLDCHEVRQMACFAKELWIEPVSNARTTQIDYRIM